MTFLGIDVSKATLDAAAILETGEVEQQRFANDASGHAQLIEWMTAFPDHCCVMEATGSYHRRLVAALEGASALVSVLNPAQVSYFAKSHARRNKTDKTDALMLALFAKERQPTPSRAVHTALQALVRELHALQEDITRLKNRLEAAEHGLTHPKVISSLKRRIEALEEEGGALQEELERECWRGNAEELSLRNSIPGIATKSACLFLAEIGDVRRFPSASKLVAYAGLTPTRVTSGTSVNKRSRISKLGSAELRRILYMPGLVGIRHNPILKAFYERLIASGKPKKAALLACVAKLLRIIYGVLIHRRRFDSNYSSA